MKGNFYKLRKNSRYNYTPRYYNGKDSGNLYEFDSRFHKYKNTTNSNDFGAHWADARSSSRNRGNRELNSRVVIIILVLLLVVLWILDFDLSIFSY